MKRWASPGPRPLIGITGPRIHAAEIASTPAILRHALSDTQYAYYAQAVARAGGLPVVVPRENAAVDMMARLDGLVLAGGQDVDPRLYGRQPRRDATPIDPARDRFESSLLLEALAQDRPVLGICRGMQLMNVALGGTLVPDLTAVQGMEHTLVLYPPEWRVHPVRFGQGTRLHDIYGDVVDVNSFHRQSIETLGERIRVAGRAPDDVIEGIEVVDARAIGVQWHPEMLGEADPLLRWLVDEATTTGARLPKGVAVEHDG